MTDDLPAPFQDKLAAKADGADTELVDDFFSDKAESTIRAYRADILRFAEWLGFDIDNITRAREEEILERVMRSFLKLGGKQANRACKRFRDWMKNEKEWAPATRNRRLSAVKSMAKLGRTMGVIHWTVEVSGDKVTPYRDTSGPTFEEFVQMVEEVHPPEDAKDRRDYAMLRLAYSLALRRAEYAALDCEDVDLARRQVTLTRKGKEESEEKTVPEHTAVALQSVIDDVGGEGPLFRSWCAIDGYSDQRITVDGVYHIVRTIAERAGAGKVSPHGLRHAAITHYLERSEGDIYGAQKLSGHAKPETLMIYDDNRKDLSGEASADLDVALTDALEEA